MITVTTQTRRRNPGGVLGGAVNTAPAGAPDDLQEVFEVTVPGGGQSGSVQRRYITSLEREVIAAKPQCREEDPELFFPLGDSPQYDDQVAEAKLVCDMCSVRQPCLLWALETGQRDGIWGGTTPKERAQLKRRATRSATAARTRMAVAS